MAPGNQLLTHTKKKPPPFRVEASPQKAAIVLLPTLAKGPSPSQSGPWLTSSESPEGHRSQDAN